MYRLVKNKFDGDQQTFEIWHASEALYDFRLVAGREDTSSAFLIDLATGDIVREFVR